MNTSAMTPRAKDEEYEEAKSPQRASDDLHAIVCDLRSDFAKLKDSILATGTEKASDLKTSATDSLEMRKRQALELTDRVADTVRRSPLKSILIAAGVGVIYGMLRRS